MPLSLHVKSLFNRLRQSGLLGWALVLAATSSLSYAHVPVSNPGDQPIGSYAPDRRAHDADLVPAEDNTAEGPSYSRFTNRTLANFRVYGVYAQGNTVYAATSGGLSISTNGGQHFTNRTTDHGLGHNRVYGVYTQGNTVYAATYRGLSISTDGGQHFTTRTTADGLGYKRVYGVYAQGNTIYAATEGGLSISTDGGQRFTNYTTADGLGRNVVLGVYVQDNTVYAATEGGLSLGMPSPTLTDLTASPGSVCAGQPIRFSASMSHTSGPYSYTLAGGGSSLSGTSSSGDFNQTLTAVNAGQQTFTLTVQASTGSAVATTSLTVGSHPDYQPLVDLYNSTNGPGWTNQTNWLSGCDPCNGWYGVKCSGGRVTELSLSKNGLDGRIPESIGNLTNLQRLSFYINQLSGTIPASLSKLTNLQTLMLSYNQLSGSIPESVGKLTNLQSLQLEHNQLSGPIPSSLGNLINVTYLRLDHNQLSGPIPESLGSLGSKTRVHTIDLSNNQLSGCYPASLSAFCRATDKFFYNNAGLPDGGSMEGFRTFCATGNGIHPDYQPLVDLYNSTNGPGWTNQTNWLSGCDPCRWQGVTCSEGRVTGLSLRGNGISGTIPESLSSLTNLQQLLLDNNQLSGSIPTSLGNLTQLQSLLLNNNQFTGSIPTSLGNLTNLEYLYLYGNQLSGSIPESLGNLTRLQYLMLDRNQLSGPIPASLANLTRLKELLLQNNQLSGCYPASLTALCGIQTKNFSGNVGLPDKGSEAGFSAFCATGKGSDAFVPTATASVSSLCVGGVVSLSTTGGSTYSWTAPTGAVLTGSASSSVVSASLTAPGEQTFTVVVNQGGTCSQTATVTVTADSQPPMASLTTSGEISCTNPSITLTAMPATGFTYAFSSGTTQLDGGNTAKVTQAGAYSVVLTSPNGCTATASVEVTGSCVPTLAKLSVWHQDGDNNQPQNNTIKPTLQLVNEGTAPIPYSEITLRYWLTVEDFAPLTNLTVYSAPLGTDKVRMKYVQLDQPRQGALGYVEYSFDASAGHLAAGASSGPIQSGIGKQNLTYLNESDDYSYSKNTSLTKTQKITLYLNGKLLGGQEPPTVSPVQKLKVASQNRSAATTNSINTYVKLYNEGNRPISYQYLTIVYWLTADSPAPLNFLLDYAWLGQANLKGKLVRIPNALEAADSYLEISFDAGLGQLYPFSNTGDIQYRLTKSDGSVFYQPGDYSYQSANSMLDNSRMSVYLDGVRVYGSEPPFPSSPYSPPSPASPKARLAADESGQELKVTVLGNPIQGDDLVVEVEGAQGQPLRLLLTDLQGRIIGQHQVMGQSAKERHVLSVAGQSPGTLLLRVSTPTQFQTLKVIKVQ
ncbi:Leucine-rich repeat (LRR) protein [Larkinella arboricola]|uniref:Leucine-rich repeat (LRR) protein n=1 Tax=Larkinella arboricola TaxID=643671 RepID=A0A327WQ88_LARAB|nr:cellulose binding domain-containing protein [Larkinella arboricola]RAJ93002.1 Leucine-rich repeat (LRR) protein [Larkinella arboricola]